MDDKELDESLEHLFLSEEYRTGADGFGTTKQGQALAREYRKQLADKIAADRTYGHRNRDVWRALKGMDDGALAITLLVAATSVTEGGDLGVDKHGEKNFRDQARWIGLNFGQQRKLGLKVGEWGVKMLTSLSPPPFALDAGGVLKMTALVDEIMDDVLAGAVVRNPRLSPRLSPPVPWTQVRKGGLPADHWANVPLIRERHPSIENAVSYAISRGRMQPVLDAVNILQRVSFAINKPVLYFILRDGEPPAPAETKPPIWQKKKRQKWAKELAGAKIFHLDMVRARTMAAAERFWVPLNVDFRGRLYGISHFNFAREDYVRALFLFADGEPIGERGLLWLKSHVAGTAKGNEWSTVKKPGELGFYDRIKWTEANLETLCDIGRAVLRRDDPATLAWALAEVKDRYQFLAACVELAQAIDEGPDFKTRLPLMFDGSCSGLQHLCAMTRAEEGKLVNLSDAFDRYDFYGLVAKVVWNAAPDLRHLMQGPDDRDIVKQPAMSYFYGSRPGAIAKSKDGRWRPHGMTKQIIDELKERKQPTKGAKELAHAIYDAIGDMVPKAKAVRDFLEELARLYAKEGKSLRWTTPAGLPVINWYHEAEIKRIPVSLNGRRRNINFVVGDKEDIDAKKAADAVTANFVHSVDATHLQAVAIEAAKAGIETICVHDCFGCIAPHAWRLKEAIHVKFVQLHRCNLLAEVLASARATLPKNTKLRPLPETGTLKLEEMLLNFHAFTN